MLFILGVGGALRRNHREEGRILVPASLGIISAWPMESFLAKGMRRWGRRDSLSREHSMCLEHARVEGGHWTLGKGAGSRKGRLERGKTGARQGLPTGLGRAFLCLHVFSVMRCIIMCS